MAGCRVNQNGNPSEQTIDPRINIVEPSSSSNSCEWQQTIKPMRFGYSSPVIEHEGLVYFITSYGIETVSDHNTNLLIENPSITGLYLNDQSIYYSVDSKEIYKMHLDGSEVQLVWNYADIDHYDEGNSIWDFTIYQDVLYIFDSLMLRSYNLITEQDRIIVNDVDSFGLSDSKLFYVDHAEKTFTIYQQDPMSQQRSIARGNGEWIGSEDEKNRYDGVVAFNNSLFYTTRFPASLYKFDENGNDLLITTMIENENNQPEFIYLSVNEDKLYYAGEVERKLYEYDTETGSSEVIVEIDDFSPQLTFNVINNTVFYFTSDNEFKILNLSQ